MDDQSTELPFASPCPQPSIVQAGVLVHEFEEGLNDLPDPEQVMFKILARDKFYLCLASFLSQAPCPNKNLVELVMVRGEPENSPPSEESPDRFMFLKSRFVSFLRFFSEIVIQKSTGLCIL